MRMLQQGQLRYTAAAAASSSLGAGRAWGECVVRVESEYVRYRTGGTWVPCSGSTYHCRGGRPQVLH